MGRFEFRNRSADLIELDIEGLKISVPGSMDYAEKLENLGKRMAEKSEYLASVEDARDFMLDVLDELLGTEAMDSIESIREPDYYDCLDLFRYITEEVSAYHAKRAENYLPETENTSPPPMALAANRRSRRRA